MRYVIFGMVNPAYDVDLLEWEDTTETRSKRKIEEVAEEEPNASEEDFEKGSNDLALVPKV